MSSAYSELFKKCTEKTQDIYWINLYTNASKGKLPPNYAIKEGHLVFRHKKRPEKVLLPLEDPQFFYEVCDMFFRKTGGLMSDLEKTAQWEKHENTFIPQHWSEIKSTAQRKALREVFIVSLVKKHNLTKREQFFLEHNINLGFTLGAFSNVLLENGRIKEIVDLHWDESHRQFFFHKPKNKIKKSVSLNAATSVNDEHTLKENIFIHHWSKFVKSISKPEKTIQKNIYSKLSSGSSALPTPNLPKI